MCVTIHHLYLCYTSGGSMIYLLNNVVKKTLNVLKIKQKLLNSLIMDHY